MNRFKSLRVILSLAILVLASRSALAEVTIEFDYRYDSDGFFDEGTSQGLERRARMEQAASFLRFSDALSAITPNGTDTWSVDITHPSEFRLVTLQDLEIPEDTFVIYPGGRYIPAPGVLGLSHDVRNLTRSGSPDFVNAVDTRGQSGALATPATDVAPNVASITFYHSDSWSWHTGATTDGLESGESDFLTTAIHEIGHLLGIGSSESWSRLVEETPGGDLVFQGPASSAIYGGPVPTNSIGNHFGEGVMGLLGTEPQETLMDPSTPRGVRQLPTDLDYAALSDIGWQVVPEPSTGLLVLLAIAGGWLFRRLPRLGSAIVR